MRNKKLSKEDLLRAQDRIVPDIIAPELKILFCGINPGLYTAAVGYHFARPGNRFWKGLYESGLTPRLFLPSEGSKLLERGYGITNIASRPTVRASQISDRELIEGISILKEKIQRYNPKWVVFLGIDAFRKAFSEKKVAIGRQKMTLGKTKVWVLPNPSGLNANYTPDDFARLFRQLRASIREV